jgi:hypothetical protein
MATGRGYDMLMNNTAAAYLHTTSGASHEACMSNSFKRETLSWHCAVQSNCLNSQGLSKTVFGAEHLFPGSIGSLDDLLHSYYESS